MRSQTQEERTPSGRVVIPIYVELTDNEYNAFVKKYHEAYGHWDEYVHDISITRSEIPKHYDIAKSLNAHKTSTLFRWLFKL